MYSSEIKDLLDKKKNIITAYEYMLITNSPQVNHVKYTNGWFNIWTSDGYEFNLMLVPFGK